MGADGARSRVAECFDFPGVREYVYAMQTVVPYDTEDEFVDIFLGKDIAPGFFAWIIPEGRRARIGLGVGEGHNLKEYFRKFLKMLDVKEGEKCRRHTSWYAWKIVRRKYLSCRRCSRAGKGDIWRGIYPGLVGAKVLASSIQEFMGGGNCSYRREYMAEFGKELKKSMFFRKLFLKAEDKKIDAIFNSIDANIIKTINDYGDIDYPSRLAKEIVKKHTKLLKFLFLPF